MLGRGFEGANKFLAVSRGLKFQREFEGDFKKRGSKICKDENLKFAIICRMVRDEYKIACGVGCGGVTY